MHKWLSKRPAHKSILIFAQLILTIQVKCRVGILKLEDILQTELLGKIGSFKIELIETFVYGRSEG